VAKSSIVFDVKPEDSETNLDDVEKAMRKEIVMEGLHWGVAERVPVAFGIFKLRVMTTVVDDLVSTDDLEEKLAALPGVQSVDIHAFNKI
jgi:translation elongation factor EF-1beta